MALKAVVDSLDGLPDDVRKEYVKGEGDFEGKFVLDVATAGGLQLHDPTKLQAALQKERKARTDAEKKAKAFEGIELDGDSVREALQELERLRELGGGGADAKRIKELEDNLKKQYAQQSQQLSEKHQRELAAIQAKLQNREKQVHQALLVREAMEALVEVGGDATLLMPHVERQAKVIENDDGTMRVAVLDAEGNERITSKPGNTGTMSLKELVSEMRESDKFGKAFKASDARGSGATGGRGAGGRPADFSGMSATERLKAARRTAHS